MDDRTPHKRSVRPLSGSLRRGMWRRCSTFLTSHPIPVEMQRVGNRRASADSGMKPWLDFGMEEGCWGLSRDARIRPAAYTERSCGEVAEWPKAAVC